LALADAGDYLDDANFAKDTANTAVLSLFTELEWIESTIKSWSDEATPSGTEDTWQAKAFANAMNQLIHETHEHYSRMMMRDALRTGWFLFQRARDEYRDWAKKAKQPMSRELIRRFIDAQARVIAPVCPHWAEYVWSLIPGTSGSITAAGWPEAAPTNHVLKRSYDFMRETLTTKCQTVGKAKKEEKHCVIYVASQLPLWKIQSLAFMRDLYAKNGNTLPDDLLKGPALKGFIESDPSLKKETKNIMQFVSFTKNEVAKVGPYVMDEKLPFDQAEVLNSNKELIQLSASLASLEIACIDGDGFAAAPGPEKKKQTATPGKPAVWLHAG
jgi:leucyl-tRNA synthetase